MIAESALFLTCENRDLSGTSRHKLLQHTEIRKALRTWLSSSGVHQKARSFCRVLTGSPVKTRITGCWVNRLPAAEVSSTGSQEVSLLATGRTDQFMVKRCGRNPVHHFSSQTRETQVGRRCLGSFGIVMMSVPKFGRWVSCRRRRRTVWSPHRHLASPAAAALGGPNMPSR